MENKEQKCPLCSTKLKMINGRMTCRSCGYYIRSQDGQEDFQDAPQYGSGYQAGSSWQDDMGYQSGTGNQDSAGCQTDTENQSSMGYRFDTRNQDNAGYQTVTEDQSSIGNQSNVGYQPGTGNQSNAGYQSGTGNQSNAGYQSGTGNQSNAGYQTDTGNQSSTAYQSGTGYQSNAVYQSSTAYQSNAGGQSDTIYSPNTGYYQVNTGGQSGIPQGSVRKGKSAGAGIVIAAITGCCAVLALVVGMAYLILRSWDGQPYQTAGRGSAASEQQDGAGRRTPEGGRDAGGQTEGTAPAGREQYLPKSDFFRQMAEVIWKKDYEDITAKEYASLTALQLDISDKTIYYQLDYGSTQTLTFESGISRDLSDLRAFTGLEWLSVDDDLSAGDLKGLDYLYGVYAENTIEELLAIVPDAENIYELGVEDSIFKKSIDGIDGFPNLEYLTVDYGALEDISALAQLPNLYGLTLIDCDRLTDYSPLMELTGLEQLSIESSQLKSIDFIKVMPGLDSLYIEDSRINSLAALESCPLLTYLCLIDNYEVEDYSIVGTLENLTDLVLEMGSGGELPSMEKLTQLQNLSIKYASDLTPLKDAVGVTYLSLDRCSGWELDALASMQELDTLVISDFSSIVYSLEPLTRLPRLEMLEMDEVFVAGDIEEIFGIPTLRYLYVDGCQVGINFDKIPANDTLEALSLDGTSVLSGPDYNRWERSSLKGHDDLFEKFPNLTELYLTSVEIDNIDFVENLPRLQYLDITDNHVTSLKPLEDLRDFRIVWCGGNTILEKVSDDSGITVITSE